MRIHLIRHADPDYPGKTITPAGHREAAALARRLAAERTDRLYSSPLGRARDTARYTADLLRLEVAIEPWTTELDGLVLGGGTVRAWNVAGSAVRRLDRGALFGGTWADGPPFDPPNTRAICEKVGADSDAFLARHGYVREADGYRVERPSRERIAVFCHAGFGLTWLAHLLGTPAPLVWSGFWLAPSSVTTILFEDRGEGLAAPRCLGVGDVSHLHAEGLPVAPRGLLANVD